MRNRLLPLTHTEILTVRCWNNQARIMLVAILGKMPRFFCRLAALLASESSSAVPSPDPILLSRPSPTRAAHKPLQSLNDHHRHAVEFLAVIMPCTSGPGLLQAYIELQLPTEAPIPDPSSTDLRRPVGDLEFRIVKGSCARSLATAVGGHYE